MNTQRGAALLTVLLLLAVMTVLAMSQLDSVRLALARAHNSQFQQQGREVALMAEQVARHHLPALARPDPRLLSRWHRLPQAQQIGGHHLIVQLADVSACFNLNSVVIGAPGQWQANPTGMAQYTALLQALSVPASQTDVLVNALVDWIDHDNQPGAGGQEDAGYLLESPPRHSAGQLLADPSELRSIAGHDRGLLARLLPWVCTLPDNHLSPINVNALQPSHAPLLVMLSGGRISLPAARQWLSARPADGWPQRAAFWAHPALQPAASDPDVASQIRLSPHVFSLQLQVQRDDSELEMHSLLQLDDSGQARLLSRRWTLDP